MRARLLIGFLLIALPLVGQSAGELRLKVTDPEGLGVKTTVALVSEANEYRNSFSTSDSGTLVAKRLPFGLYRVEIHQPGFAEVSVPVEIRSAIPTESSVQLSLASVTTSVDVRDSDTLIDPHRADSSNEIGTETIETRTTSLPGRSLQDLVNSQPGWLYEGNAVLHPRGSEYQTQFVVDGIPLTDNRSPELWSGDRSRRRRFYECLHRGHSRRIWPQDGRRHRGQHAQETASRDCMGELAFPAAASIRQEHLARRRMLWKRNTLGASASRQHDEPLSESCCSGELHQQRDHGRFLRCTTSAI